MKFKYTEISHATELVWNSTYLVWNKPHVQSSKLCPAMDITPLLNTVGQMKQDAIKIIRLIPFSKTKKFPLGSFHFP